MGGQKEGGITTSHPFWTPPPFRGDAPLPSLWARGARLGEDSRSGGVPCRPPPARVRACVPPTQVYEEKQRRCEQELEGLRQRCAAQARQAAQAAQRGQQVLQLQVLQLQQEKKQLQEDLAQLLQERELLERRCASFQRERTELAPRLEETKWEVSRPAALGESGGAGSGW